MREREDTTAINSTKIKIEPVAGWTSKAYGGVREFETEGEARVLYDWLCQLPGSGIINIFEDRRMRIWCVTQYITTPFILVPAIEGKVITVSKELTRGLSIAFHRIYFDLASIADDILFLKDLEDNRGVVTVDTLVELQQSISELSVTIDSISDGLKNVAADIQFLKDEIASGGVVKQAELDDLAYNVNSVRDKAASTFVCETEIDQQTP